MMIGAIGFGELMLILLAAVLVLGPDKAPQTARQLGKIVREFRQTMNGMTDD
ncbi:MAG: twin-arginine translocase TatA/TatE family subunit, partial [Peptococcus niger]